MKKALRIIGIIVVVGLIIAAIAASTAKKDPSTAEMVWDEQTTVGDINAKNHFIIYSDFACPYCVAFENAIVEHEDDFQKYIKENDILVEVRLSDYLYEFGESNPIHSRYSAVAAYCAKKEGKFWDYYNRAIASVWNDYFKDLGKGALSKTSGLDKTYWTNIGKAVGLGDSFATCVDHNETLDEIKTNAKRSAKLINSMPYFKFNDYTSSGFDLSWGWQYVQMYFQAGLDSKK
ncbi:MAG: thioredoxin domain-containing protein [Candidatus Saccharibacteria bacterium]|nr:thioredoxin domain-containing protein [Candidatus Saccharibacteria bacterium]